MTHVKKRDLEFALNLLEVSIQELKECKDLKKLELKIRKRWHPDRAIGLGLDEHQIARYTRISQKIPICMGVFKLYQAEQLIKSKKKSDTVKKTPKFNKNNTFLQDLAQLVKTGKENNAEKLAAVSFVNAALNNDKKLVKKLLKFGVDIDGGFTSFPPLCFVVKENNAEMTRFLLSLGASPNVEMDARRVIVYALENKNLEITELLLKAGADPNRFSRQYSLKWTLLMDRIAKDDLSFIKLLVKYGADINAVTFYPGWSPLLEAVKNERVEIVKYLLKAGADPKYSNKQGTTAQRLAGKLGNRELIDLLKQK